MPRAQAFEPGEVFVGGACIDDDAEQVCAQEVDDQVVEHAAVFAQEA